MAECRLCPMASSSGDLCADAWSAAAGWLPSQATAQAGKVLSARVPGRRVGAGLAGAGRLRAGGGTAPGTGRGSAGTSPLVDKLADIYYDKISKNDGGGRHERGKPARETTRIC